jgi:hypothetical protein
MSAWRRHMLRSKQRPTVVHRRAWGRGVLLSARRQRLSHRHHWIRLLGTILDDKWRCTSCPKRVTAYQVMAAGRDGLADLFMPMVDWQVKELERSFRR